MTKLDFSYLQGSGNIIIVDEEFEHSQDSQANEINELAL